MEWLLRDAGDGGGADFSPDPAGTGATGDTGSPDPDVDFDPRDLPAGQRQGGGKGDAGAKGQLPLDQQQHALVTKTQQENAQLKSRLAALENMMNSIKGSAMHQPPAQKTSGFQLDPAVVQFMGEDEALKLQQGIDSYVNQMLGTVTGQIDDVRFQMEETQFYTRFPEMREYKGVIDRMDTMLNQGEVAPIEIMAMAARGLNMTRLVEQRVAAEREKWEKEERAKFLQALGSGKGVKPTSGPDRDKRIKEVEDAFGVKKPTFANKPPD